MISNVLYVDIKRQKQTHMKTRNKNIMFLIYFVAMITKPIASIFVHFHLKTLLALCTEENFMIDNPIKSAHLL